MCFSKKLKKKNSGRNESDTTKNYKKKFKTFSLTPTLLSLLGKAIICRQKYKLKMQKNRISHPFSLYTVLYQCSELMMMMMMINARGLELQ